jgi:imidazolonepropionase
LPWLDDYEARIAGVNPLEAMTGWKRGIESVKADTTPRLETRTRRALDGMVRHGTTTCEVKSGYGCDAQADLKALRVLERLDGRPLDIVRSYLAVTSLLASGRGRPAAPDLDRVRSQTLPAIARRKLARFADVYVDAGDNVADATARYLETARELGFGLKIHTDQFRRSGGVALALQHGALSVDHLEYAEPEDVAALARSSVIATLLPGSGFHLGSTRYAPARALVDGGAAIALASNFNPNTCPTYNMQMVLSLACTHMRLTPAEAISAATINGAHALGRADKAGSLEVGKSADLLVLNVAEYREIPYHFGVNTVHMTVKRGRVIYREGVVEPRPPER